MASTTSAALAVCSLLLAGALLVRSARAPSSARSQAEPPCADIDPAFVLAGPLAARCGLRCAADLDARRWAALAAFLFDFLGVAPSAHDERVHWYYLPVYTWLRALLDAREASAACAERALLAGVQCVQGGGKTSLVSALCALFGADPQGARVCVGASIDDFYLPHDGLNAVAAAHPDNPLLQVRGLPSTHDVALCVRTVDALRRARAPGSRVLVPRFDKGAHGGRGDRRPRSEWSEVAGRVDVVLVEGWCLGFSPRAPDAPPLCSAHLCPVDAALRAHDGADFVSLHGRMDAWLVVRVGHPAAVYRWREEAEAEARRAGRGAMSEGAVRAFCDCYMPAYRQYLPAVYGAYDAATGLGREGAALGAGRPQLQFAVDDGRAPCADGAAGAAPGARPPAGLALPAELRERAERVFAC